MVKAKIKWNLKSFAEIRNCDEVKEALQEKVNAILDEINDDQLYESEVTEGKHRAAGRVWTAGTHAERSNAKHNTLIHALAAIEGDA